VNDPVVNDPLPAQEESVTAQRTRVLARMATSRSTLRSENQAWVDSKAPLSVQSRTVLVAPFARASPLTTFIASPNAPIVAALLVGSVILGPRRVIIAAAVPLVRAVIGRAARDIATR
jgi:hypothetical protein